MTITQVEVKKESGTFGSRAKALLKERHPSKPMMLVSEETGLSYATLQKALNDETQPRYATLVTLAEYLECPVSYLVDGNRGGEVPTSKKMSRSSQFLALVRRRPGIKANAIAKELGMRTGYVYHIAARLLREGYVRKDDKNRYFLITTAEEKAEQAGGKVKPTKPAPKPQAATPVQVARERSATGMATGSYRDGYRDGYADAVKMLAGRPVTAEQFAERLV